MLLHRIVHVNNFYIASVCGIGAMYYYYGQSLKCYLNIFFITWTAILLTVIMEISLHSKFRKDIVQEEEDIPYDYGFFHMVFALGTMYFAMLFISWNLNNSAQKWSIDVGWASTWVKIVNEWFAATIYLWKLISPVVRQPISSNSIAISSKICSGTLRAWNKCQKTWWNIISLLPDLELPTEEPKAFT